MIYSVSNSLRVIEFARGGVKRVLGELVAGEQG